MNELISEKQILGKTGENVNIEPMFWCDYGWNIEVGENFYANHGLVILDGGKVTFGDNVFIAPSCGFHTAGHPIDFERRNLQIVYIRSHQLGYTENSELNFYIYFSYFI